MGRAEGFTRGTGSASHTAPYLPRKRAKLDHLEVSRMKKKHHPLHNLGAFAHAPKAEQNFRTLKSSTQPNTMKLIGKAAKATGKKRRA
jgi:hypothetical protein